MAKNNPMSKHLDILFNEFRDRVPLGIIILLVLASINKNKYIDSARFLKYMKDTYNLKNSVVSRTIKELLFFRLINKDHAFKPFYITEEGSEFLEALYDYVKELIDRSRE